MNLLKLLLHYINLFYSAASVPLCLPSEVSVWHRQQSGGGAGRLLRGRGVHRQTECDGSTQPSRDTGSHFPQTRSTMMRLTSSSCRRFYTMSLPASAARALFSPAFPFIRCLLIAVCPTISASLQLSCCDEPLFACMRAHNRCSKQILLLLFFS